MPIISHIKVPSIELNSQGKEIIKAKKLIVAPPHTKPRSLSAQSRFRHIFQVPKTSKDSFKESSPKSINLSQEKLPSGKTTTTSFRKIQNFTEIKYLNEICQQMMKDNSILKSRIEEQENVIKTFTNKKPQVLIPKILMNSSRVSPKVSSNNEDLVTFRPDLTPNKKQFRFPREIFCAEGKKKLVI